MNKTKPMNSDNQGATFLQEYLRRNALELYEWHIKLDYLSTSDRLRHNVIKQVSGTPDDNGGACFLCKECHESLLASGKYEVLETVHDPEVHPFPPKYDDFLRRSLEGWCDARFKKDAEELLEEMKRDGDNIYFPDDPEKEYAMVYLDAILHEGREESPIDDIRFFRVLSLEARLLAIIYRNFREYQNIIIQNIIKWSDDELLALLDEWRDCVIGESHEMIGYWRLGDKLKKWGKAGGRASKKPQGILQAIEELLEEKDYRGMTISSQAHNLWEHFRRNHYQEPYYTGEYEIIYENNFSKDEDHAGRLIEKLEGKSKFLQYDRFKKHVSDILKKPSYKK